MSAAEDRALRKAKEANANAWGPLDLGDDGVALRFAASEQGDALGWVPAWRSWVEWQGDRWVRVSLDVTKNRIRSFVRGAIVNLASRNGDGEALTKLTGYLARRERINAVEGHAKGDLLLDAEVFDADPLLLNCRNGTLDLRTVKLREHRPEDFLTQRTNCDYDPRARSADWQKVLNDALPREVVAYLRRVFGYTLTGSCSEHKFFPFFGKEGAGKTSVQEGFGWMMGDYTASVSAATFTSPSFKKSGSDPTPDIAKLRGARFVYAAEFNKGDKLSDGRIKAMTGGNTITARELHGRPFDFMPQFKVFLDANHKPRVQAREGFNRRLVLIEFAKSIPKADRDPGLAERLKTPEAAAGILVWAVTGYRQWVKSGLGELPSTIQDSNEEYLAESDLYGDFVEEALQKVRGAKTTTDEMYRAYRMWAGKTGHKPAAKNTLGSELKDQGFQAKKTNVRKGRKWTSTWAWRDVEIRKGFRVRVKGDEL